MKRRRKNSKLATTAFGKTVIGEYLIAERKMNTLILVHRTNLLSQWIDRLNEFLIIKAEPVPELTPTGRKKKMTVIGLIGGGKNNPGRIGMFSLCNRWYGSINLLSYGKSEESIRKLRNYGRFRRDEILGLV